MSAEDLAFYERRFDEESRKATLADSPDVRLVHVQLAALYEARIAGLKAGLPGATQQEEADLIRNLPRGV